jgi:hypothetical protein
VHVAVISDSEFRFAIVFLGKCVVDRFKKNVSHKEVLSSAQKQDEIFRARCPEHVRNLEICSAS